MSAYEPWRYRCPNGHASWTARDTGDGMRNGEPADTRFRCETCGVEFDRLRDAKTQATAGGEA